jgi:hypothetical protein
VFNGIWEAPFAFQLSGVYFFGSGQRFGTNVGVDRRDRGTGSGGSRLRADGSIAPRNAIVGKPIHRIDLRLQRRFRLGGRLTADGLFEVFNLFNHRNYGSYVTNESNARFGQPDANANISYQPRVMQMGFRFAF